MTKSDRFWNWWNRVDALHPNDKDRTLSNGQGVVYWSLAIPVVLGSLYAFMHFLNYCFGPPPPGGWCW
jgi:hypothetical protein